jgi:hypothetical protein
MTSDLKDIMDQDKFLAFKGLKQYSPESGWESVGNAHESAHPAHETLGNSAPLGAQTSGPYAHAQHSNRGPSALTAPGNVLDHGPSAQKYKAPRAHADDPLITELFDQLRQPVEDELSASWKLIAANVNLLTQRMDQERLLRAQLKALEEETQTLRAQILTHLEDVQKTADRQLSVARLRVEVSNMAKSKLSDKLQKI